MSFSELVEPVPVDSGCILPMIYIDSLFGVNLVVKNVESMYSPLINQTIVGGLYRHGVF